MGFVVPIIDIEGSHFQHTYQAAATSTVEYIYRGKRPIRGYGMLRNRYLRSIERFSAERTKTDRPAAKRGFTLIEVVVAMVVFAFVVIVFSSSIIIARKSSNLNGQYAQAISLCQHKIDQMRAVGFGRLNYTELSDAEIIDTTPTSAPFQFATVDQVTDYLNSPTTTIALSNPSAKETLVTVTISWKPNTYESRVSTTSLSAIIVNVE